MPRAFGASRAILAAAARIPAKPLSVMASPPAVGALATATAITSAVKWPSISTSTLSHVTTVAPCFTYRGCGRVVILGTAFPDYDYVKATHITNALLPGAASPLCVDFIFDGTQIELLFKGVTSAVLIKVDGELVSATPTTIPNTGSGYFIPITFATRKPRRISVEAAGSPAWGGVNVGPNDTVRPAKTAGPRCIVMGDSFSEGTGGDGGAATIWVRRFAESMGWDDTWVSGLGSTGFLASGSGKGTFRDRGQTDIIDHSPDVFIIAGGINDYATYSAAAIGAECALLLSQIKTALPNAVGIVLPPFWRGGVETMPVSLLDAKDAIEAAAVAAGCIFVDVLEQPSDLSAAKTLTAGVSAGATSIPVSGILPIRGAVEIGTGATRERRIVNSFSAGPNAAVAALTFAHSSGELVTPVGPCLWTGSGKVGATTGSGNSDLLVQNDGTHPTQAGHDAIGAVASAILRDLL